MSLIISLLLLLIVAAVVLWAVRTLLPILGLPEPVGTVIYVLIVVVVVIMIVQALGGGAWSLVRAR